MTPMLIRSSYGAPQQVIADGKCMRRAYAKQTHQNKKGARNGAQSERKQA